MLTFFRRFEKSVITKSAAIRSGCPRIAGLGWGEVELFAVENRMRLEEVSQDFRRIGQVGLSMYSRL